MNGITIFENSSLGDIRFIEFGKDLSVEFDSSYDGKCIGSLVCRNVIFFKYSDVSREYVDVSLTRMNDGIFPSYIVCVNIEKVNDYYRVGFEPIEENIIIHCLDYEVVLDKD